ncbi:MAG TPA: SCO family protein, partial [Asticcacaulis sp.]
AEKAYRVSAVKTGSGDTYAYSHTSVVYLMNPEGQFAVPLTAGMTAQQNADQIRQAMQEG